MLVVSWATVVMSPACRRADPVARYSFYQDKETLVPV
jgi:hypothetical protein